MLSHYEKSIEGIPAKPTHLGLIECKDAVTGNRVVVVALVDIHGNMQRPIAQLFGENENPFESLSFRSDARFDAAPKNQSLLTDEQFLRQMGIVSMGSGVSNRNHAP
jgi:hypothetical protein